MASWNENKFSVNDMDRLLSFLKWLELTSKPVRDGYAVLIALLHSATGKSATSHH